MLGALLEISGVLPQASIDAALRRLVKIRALVSNWTNVPWRGGANCIVHRARRLKDEGDG